MRRDSDVAALAGELCLFDVSRRLRQRLFVAAFNDARTKVNAHAETEMQKLTGGLALPGGMKLPF